MALHRLIAMEMGVPDPAILDAFYQQLGFRGAPGRWGGVDSEDQITLCEAPYRQLKSLRIACHDEADLAGAGARLEAIGVSSTLSQGVLKVVDPLNGWEVWLEPQEELVVAPAEPRAMNYPGHRGRINTRASVITEQEARRPRRLGHVVVGSPEPGKPRSSSERWAFACPIRSRGASPRLCGALPITTTYWWRRALFPT